MEYLSIRKCAQLKRVENADVIKTARSVYVLADELIDTHGYEMIDALPNKEKARLAELPADLQQAVLFQSLHMALESFIGGAVEQEEPAPNEMGSADKVCCVSLESAFLKYHRFVGGQYSELEYLQIELEMLRRSCGSSETILTTYNFETGETTHKRCEVDQRHIDKKIQRVLNKMKQIKSGQPIHWDEDETFETGVIDCLNYLDEVNEHLLKTYNRFCSLTYVERAKEFDAFMDRVFEINGLKPCQVAHADNRVNIDGGRSNQRG